MKADLFIPTVVIDGTLRVHPEAMDVLIRMGEHRQLCSQCMQVFEHKGGSYCATGMELNDELMSIPGVRADNIRE